MGGQDKHGRKLYSRLDIGTANWDLAKGSAKILPALVLAMESIMSVVVRDGTGCSQGLVVEKSVATQPLHHGFVQFGIRRHDGSSKRPVPSVGKK